MRRFLASLTPAPRHAGATLTLCGATMFPAIRRHWRGPVNLPPLILFFIADVIAFSAFRVIIPFIIPAVAWILGAWLGKWIITKEVADADA